MLIEGASMYFFIEKKNVMILYFLQREQVLRGKSNELMSLLKNELSVFDSAIANVETMYGPNRAGDIPHSLEIINKTKNLLGYNP